jgi:hypothetical protein
MFSYLCNIMFSVKFSKLISSLGTMLCVMWMVCHIDHYKDPEGEAGSPQYQNEKVNIKVK